MQDHGHTCSLAQLSDDHRRSRISLGRLDHQRVPRHSRQRSGPQDNPALISYGSATNGNTAYIAGKLNGVIAAQTPSGTRLE